MKKVTLSKEIQKRLSKEKYYTQDDFIKDCMTYIKAVKSGRIKYKVFSVARSGMSRNIYISSFEGTMDSGYYTNYVPMLRVLGYTVLKDNTIRVGGCGMNMLFATNYNIINSLYHMGFINKKECDILAQKVN